MIGRGLVAFSHEHQKRPSRSLHHLELKALRRAHLRGEQFADFEPLEQVQGRSALGNDGNRRPLMRPILLVGLLAAPAAAQDSGGTISGTLDLEPVVWSVASVEGELSSTWVPTETARLVRLVGVARESAESGLADAITITFRAAGNPAEPDVEDALVAYFPAGSGRTWIAEGENIDLSVEALQVAGDAMAVAGSFVAQRTPGGTEGLVGSDANIMTVDGNFQATLRRDEEGALSDN